MATDREPEALPEDISLEDLKDHAKTLHEAALAGESDARRRVEPYFDDPSSLKLRQAHLVIAREYGFASWRKLKSFVDIRDARAEALRRFQNVSARMRPSKALMREYEAANREVLRLTRRWMDLRPDRDDAETLAAQYGLSTSTEAGDAGDETGPLRCSFCPKSQHEVRKLIAGPGAFICIECVELCLQIIWDESGEPS